MISTIEYLKMADRIAKATRARELHDLSREINQAGFTLAEGEALRNKISQRFGALNAAEVRSQKSEVSPHGRFTLLPHSRPSSIRH